MARKKSVKKSASDFRRRADAIVEFVDEAEPLGDKHLSWAYEYGIIRLYREFEAMMLAASRISRCHQQRHTDGFGSHGNCLPQALDR